MTERYTVSVKKIEQLSSDIKLFTLEFKPGTIFNFEAGQFVMISFPEKNNKLLRRAYSIASSPSIHNQIQLCIKIYPDGRVSQILDKLKLNKVLNIEGPYGKFTVNDNNNDIIFIATSTGIAPIRSMLYRLIELNDKRNITLFFGFRYEDGFCFREELLNIAKKYRNITLVPAASQPKTASWKYDVGRLTSVLPKYLKKGKNGSKEFYICGSTAMVQETIKVLEKLGFKHDKFHIDAWG